MRTEELTDIEGVVASIDEARRRDFLGWLRTPLPTLVDQAMRRESLAEAGRGLRADVIALLHPEGRRLDWRHRTPNDRIAAVRQALDDCGSIAGDFDL